MFGNRKIMVYSNDDGACSHYRSVLPYNFLKHHTKYVTLSEKIPKEVTLDTMYYDIFMFQRPLSAFLHKEFIPYCKSKNKKVICDVDDNLFVLPDYNNAKAVYEANGCLYDHGMNLAKANLVTCSTVPLANYIAQNFNRNVLVIPNRLFHFFPYKETEHQENKIVKVGYSGSDTHIGDFSDELVNYLTKKINQKKIEFVCFGSCPKQLKEISTMVPYCKLDQYYPVLNNLHFDIGLIITKDNEFNRGKSNLKYIEYSMLSIPTVANAVYPYANSIVHNETGLLVNDEMNWEVYIDHLIENKAERKRLSKNAYNFVRQNFYYETAELKLINTYTQLSRMC